MISSDVYSTSSTPQPFAPVLPEVCTHRMTPQSTVKFTQTVFQQGKQSTNIAVLEPCYGYELCYTVMVLMSVQAVVRRRSGNKLHLLHHRLILFIWQALLLEQQLETSGTAVLQVPCHIASLSLWWDPCRAAVHNMLHVSMLAWGCMGGRWHLVVADHLCHLCLLWIHCISCPWHMGP